MDKVHFPNAASEFVYVRTYSRWLDDQNRRETWPETVDRYVNYMKTKFADKVPPKVFKKIRKHVLEFKVMPSMRALWSAGTALDSDNLAAYNCSFMCIDNPRVFAELLYILMNGAGAGFSVEHKHIDKLPVIPTLKNPFTNPEIHVVDDSRAGWAESLKILVDYRFAGKDINFDYSKLRPKGAKLKTFGGRSSGAEPLILLHSFVKEIFTKAQNRRLSALECHDICCQIGDTVVVGGVRRSSEISLSDLNDTEMRDCKTWPFPLRRAMANNSAVYYEKPSAVTFLKEWANLAESGTGERGIINLGAARKNAPTRRNAELIHGLNPCVSGDTLILTKNGYTPIEGLVDSKVEIWNGFEWSEVEPKVTGENQKILKIKFSDGRELKCTPYHKFHLAKGYRGEVLVKEAHELVLGDKLIKHEFPLLVEGKEANFNAYAQGFKSADGMDNYNYLFLYEPKFMCGERLGNSKPLQGKKINVKVDAPLPKSYVPFDLNLKGKLDWLAGLFDGDGCELVEGGIQLTSVDFEFLTNLQNLLSILGLQSKIVNRAAAGYKMMPDGHGGSKEYWCQDGKAVCLGAVQVQTLKSLGMKCERLKLDKEPQRDASQFSKVVSIEEFGEAEKVYCFNEPKRHLGVFNGIITGNCSEIALRHNGLCNLSEVILRPEYQFDEVLDYLETATWIGVLQSLLTDFNYINENWKNNAEEERLLGVSLTGQYDAPEHMTAEKLRIMKAKVLKVSEKASKLMNSNMPTSTTCAKPSGTVSQLVNSASGMHPRFADYYIRRYRISAHDPLCLMLESQGFEMLPENGQTLENCSTKIISFPTKSPEGAITTEQVSALEQLEWYKKIQTNWCEHNASVTIFIKPDEWMSVGDWVYKNWDSIVGVSFLPYSDHKYEQAPYEKITKEQFDVMLAKMPKIDYSKLSEFEQIDNTEGAKALACSGGLCEI